MNTNEIITEAEKLTKHELGMGMSSYQNKDIFLAGGFRSGNSDAQHTRLKFMIYDIRGITPEDFQERQDELEMGFVELFAVDSTGDIDGLVNIKLNPKARRSGLGRLVIESLKATTGSLKIFDIQRSAIPFWKKLGVTFYKDQHFTTPIEKPTGVMLQKISKFGLYAIL
ncbi:MAG: hypothetical protein DRQ35_06615 [Gammaproteobacteria bacterium]|nr:MAG: hypothetical protein DRQ35_06615 [Gammaproteobacteria bacterium]